MGPFVVGRTRCALAKWLAVLSFLGAASFSPLYAADKPPFSPDQTAPEVVNSHLSAIIRFRSEDIARELDREVPRRLATFEDRTANCGRRQCVYSGYVERAAPIHVHAEGDRMSASVPVHGFVAGEGARGLSRLVHGKAEGQMTVSVVARPRLTADWSVALSLEEGFHWTEPPVLRVLGRDIDVAPKIEPKIRSDLRRVEGRVARKVNALNLRGRAETAWQRAFEPVKILDDPEIWLQMTPQSVAYAGIHSRANALEGAIEIVGPVATRVGSTPPPQKAPPLPPPGTEVADPGRFEFLAPISIAYDIFRQNLQPVLAAAGIVSGGRLLELEVYPSAGKLVLGLRLEKPPRGADPDGWVYLSTIPRSDNSNQVIQFADISTTAASGETFDKLLDALRREVSISYKAQYDKILAAASAKLTRDWGNKFKTEANFTSAGVENISLLADRLQVVLRASGELTVVFTP